jgi:hypothetical protein
MDPASEVKVEVNITPEVETQQERYQQDEEPTIKDFMIMMQLQLQEQKKDRELIKQLLEQNNEVKISSVANAAAVKRRATIFMPNTPHRVSDRTSMGGMSNMYNGDPEGVDAYSDNDDVDLEEKGRRENFKTSSMKVKEPPIFQGEANSDVNRWLELIEDFMSCFTENEVMKVQKVMLYLGEGPRIFVKTAEQEAKKEGRPFLWKDVKQTLLECFLPTITEDIARMRLAVLKQTDSVWEYTAEFQKLDRYIRNSDPADRIDRYRKGLKEQIQRMWLQHTTLQAVTKASDPAGGVAGPASTITKLTQAIAYAVQLEAAINQYRELSKTSYPNRMPYDHRQIKVGMNAIADNDRDMINGGMDDDGAASEYGDDVQEWEKRGRLNQVNNRRPKPPKPAGMTDDKYRMLIREKRCLLCEQTGHMMWRCPKAQHPNPSNALSLNKTISSTNSTTRSNGMNSVPKNGEAPRQ